MALLTCPECGKSVSEHADFCPNCGYPISRMKERDDATYVQNERPVYQKERPVGSPRRPKKSNRTAWIVSAIAVILLGGGACLFFYIQHHNRVVAEKEHQDSVRVADSLAHLRFVSDSLFREQQRADSLLREEELQQQNVADIIKYLRYMIENPNTLYDDEYAALRKHCSPELLRRLAAEYEYDGGGYAAWELVGDPCTGVMSYKIQEINHLEGNQYEARLKAYVETTVETSTGEVIAGQKYDGIAVIKYTCEMKDGTVIITGYNSDYSGVKSLR